MPPASSTSTAAWHVEPDPSRLGGAVFVDLNRAVKDYPELLKRYLLTEAVTPADDVFAALHSAFWTSGTLLYVPKGVALDAPLFELIGLAQEGRVDLSHTLVVLEDGAEATLVRESAGRGDGLLHRRCTWARSRSSCAGRRVCDW